MQRPDLDSPERIDAFVDRFYQRVLSDAVLAPLFIDVAGIELDTHLPRIKAYWRKMLLGDDEYRRHMMEKHRQLDRKRTLEARHYGRWVRLFEETLDEGYAGPCCERARGLARRIAVNMRRNIEQFREETSMPSEK